MDNKHDIFATLAEIARMVQAIDPRITYASIGVQPTGHLHVAFHASTDEALAELADRFDLGPIERREGGGQWWLHVERWDLKRDMYVSISGPHRAIAETQAVAS